MGWWAISCLLVSGKIVFYVFGVGVFGCVFGGFGHCGGVLDQTDQTISMGCCSRAKARRIEAGFLKSSLITYLMPFPIRLPIRGLKSEYSRSRDCD